MDAKHFERLTRRLALAGLAGELLTSRLGGAETDALGVRAKRCRRKKRVFCAGRCCARG